MRFAFASKIPATKSSPPHKDTNDAQSASARGSKCFPLKSSAARNPKFFFKKFFKGENGRDPKFLRSARPKNAVKPHVPDQPSMAYAASASCTGPRRGPKTSNPLTLFGSARSSRQRGDRLPLRVAQ